MFACERFDVSRLSFCLRPPGRGVVVGCEVKHLFQPFAFLPQVLPVPVRSMNCELLRMNLVDGDMKVNAVCVVVSDGDPLMFLETEFPAYCRLHPADRVWRRVFAGAEGNEKVVCLVTGRPVVAQLGDEHFSHRQFRIFKFAIRYDDFANPVGFILIGRDVIDQLPNAV